MDTLVAFGYLELKVVDSMGMGNNSQHCLQMNCPGDAECVENVEVVKDLEEENTGHLVSDIALND